MFELLVTGAAGRLDDKDDSSRRKRPDRGPDMRMIFGIFPLLSVPIIIYNLLAMSRSSSDKDVTIQDGVAIDPNAAEYMLGLLDKPMAKVPMVAEGAVWMITVGDILILLGLVLLFVEILKSTSTGASTIFNHAISMILFIIALVEFLLFSNFATSVFFILCIMCLLDVLAGVVVTIVSARRDFAVGEGFAK